jgi:hypothetical protein
MLVPLLSNVNLNNAFVEDPLPLPDVDQLYHIKWRDNKMYVVQVLDVCDESHTAYVKFMANHDSKQLVYWPRPHDCSWEPISSFKKSVTKLVMHPLSTQRKQLYNVVFGGVCSFA